MEKMEKHLTSDIVMENSFLTRAFIKDADEKIYNEYERGGVKICRLNIRDKRDEKRYSCPCGRYVTIYANRLDGYSSEEGEEISRIVSAEICHLLACILGEGYAARPLAVLVAGLGNREITPDSIGARVSDEISVTRHVKILDKSCFESMHTASLAAISCGVLGKTGIETLELLRGALSEVQADAVIAVDALAAREYGRLGSVIQLSDVGIVPGAGIGNRRGAINSNTLGVPVIAVGVPTVVSASALICDTLNKHGLTSCRKELDRELDSLAGFFVTPKECDAIVSASAKIIARGIEYALM